jgi:hypothetical protein
MRRPSGIYKELVVVLGTWTAGGNSFLALACVAVSAVSFFEIRGAAGGRVQE